MNKTEIAVDIFNRQAKPYMDKFMDVSSYAEGLDIFCAMSKQEAEVLELACGPGNISRYLLNKRPDLNILGTDLAPNMLRLAQENNPEATFQLLDCRDIKSLKRKFDALMCGFALPYLSKEEAIQFIKDTAELLPSNGVIYISTMEDDYSKSGFKTGSSGEAMYLHYHEGKYLLQELEENGFRLNYLRRQEYAINGEIVFQDLILVAQKK